MRILLIHKFFIPRGGADRHVHTLGTLLSEAGHTVHYGAMEEPGVSTDIAFPNVDFSSEASDDLLSSIVGYCKNEKNKQKVQNAFRAMRYGFSNPEGKKLLEKFLDSNLVDIVHLHNVYHHISASIIAVCTERHIPVVQTIHDYHLVSPVYNGYAKGVLFPTPWQTVSKKMIRDSTVLSVLSALSFLYECTYYAMVSRFIAPSAYAADIVSDRYREIPIDVIPHPVPHACDPSEKRDGKTFVWLGRRDAGKGYELLPKLADALSDGWTIAAIGVDADAARKDGLTHEKIAWLGGRDSADICSALRSARALLYPTVYPETFGLAVAEAVAAHCPVIANDRGAVAELMRAEEFDSESPYGTVLPPPVSRNAVRIWQDAVRDVCESPLKFDATRADADVVNFSSEVFLKRIESVYETVLREYA